MIRRAVNRRDLLQVEQLSICTVCEQIEAELAELRVHEPIESDQKVEVLGVEVQVVGCVLPRHNVSLGQVALHFEFIE